MNPRRKAGPRRRSHGSAVRPSRGANGGAPRGSHPV